VLRIRATEVHRPFIVVALAVVSVAVSGCHARRRCDDVRYDASAAPIVEVQIARVVASVLCVLCVDGRVAASIVGSLNALLLRRLLSLLQSRLVF
jgi:hypothetical protein